MSKPPQKNKNKRINIELPEEIAGGTYANLVVISHFNTEFIVDFAKILPGMPKAKVCNRVLLSPQNAKRMLNALNESIVQYEAKRGIIKETTKGVNDFPPIQFGGPPTQA